MKQEQDLAAKIAAQTAKKTAKVESAAAKKIAAAERAAEKKTAAAERKMLKRAAKAEKQAKKLQDVVVYSEKIESVLPEETEEPPEETPPVDEEKTPPAEGEEDPEGDAKAEEEPEEPALTATRYRYENVTDPKGLMSAYAGLLTQEAAGFSAVDKTFQRMDLPDFDGMEASEGQEAVPASKSVLLARNSDGDDGLVYSLQLDWDETTCTVVVDTPEGRVHNPPSEDQSGPVSAGLTVDGFRELDPSVLGLPGASMDEYTVYVQDGMLLVYGNTCVRISVYAQNANTGTNEVAGSYFLSADGQHVYRYDVTDNSVEELEIPK